MSDTALVTGATGNLGNAIVRRLLAGGRPVRCLVRNVERAEAALPSGVELVRGELTDPPSVHDAMRGVHSVFHAAGIPEQWQKDPGIFERVNTEGTRTMVDAALDAGVERFIYTSTQDVFDLSKAEFDETTVHSRQDCSAYERSKHLAQDIVDRAVEQRGLPAVSLHPVAIYGPCVSTPTGLTALIEQLRTNDVPILIGGGFPVVFNDDAAAGHLLAEDKAPVGEKYILTDRYYTLTEMAEAVSSLRADVKVPRVMPDFIADLLAFVGALTSRVTGRPPLISKGELQGLRRTGRPNGDKSRRQLGWSTTPFEEGLEATLRSLESLESRASSDARG